VRPSFGDPPAIEQLSDDVRRAVDGTYDVAQRLAKRDADYAVPPPGGYPDPQVLVTSGGSRGTTVVEVRAHDQPGLLHRVTTAVAAADASIVSAKVSTLGADVVDVFFVTDSHGRPLSDDRMAALRVTVLSSLR
jgi:[protein-PII] uridylyltransferase